MIHLGLKRKARKLISGLPFIRFEHFCNCCGYNLSLFQPWGGDALIYQKSHIVGGGRRLAKCPICGSIDRERWMLFFLEHGTKILQEECHVLHFAPEPAVRQAITRNTGCVYISGDITRGRADMVMDITDIPFKKGYFDYIIANHVLSYVKDEGKAFAEMRRCLKDDGRIILSFPIRMDVDTYDKELGDERQQEAEFGVKGNLRMYGRDFRRHLEGFGLETECFSPSGFLPDAEIHRMGLLPDDVTIVCRKIMEL